MGVRFAAEGNLGKLAKWLRILGYDTKYLQGNADRNFLMEAAEEGRIVLTRRRSLTAQSTPVRIVVLMADRAAAQIGEVLEALALEPDPALRMTRCLGCNMPLEAVARGPIEGLVPAYVYQENIRFQRCPCCNGIFWPGTHRGHVEEALRRRSPDRLP